MLTFTLYALSFQENLEKKIAILYINNTRTWFIVADANAYARADVADARSPDGAEAKGWGTPANSPRVGESPLKLNGSALNANNDLD